MDHPAIRRPESPLSLVDGLLPPTLRHAAPDPLSRARLTAIACTLLVAGHVGAGASSTEIGGLFFVAAGNFTAAIFAALLLVLLRAGFPIALVAHGLIADLFVFVAVIAGTTGGDANGALYTVTMIPGAAILLRGRSAGFFWTLIACALIAAIWGLRSNGFEFPSPLDPERTAISKFPSAIAIMLGVTAMIVLYEWIKDRALADLALAQRTSEASELARLQLEARMLETQKLESLGVLAGGVAHDFNNLLTVILGNASLIADGFSQDARPLATEITLAAEQAGNLTDQLLAYAGRSRLDRKPVSLAELVHRLESLARTATAPDVELRYELAAGTAWAIADRGQIQQVLLNLITNASEAIQGSGMVVVRTGALEVGVDGLPGGILATPPVPGSYVYLEVEDDGEGMPPEIRARICDPFFTTKSHGRGLGLSAVLGIVRAHAGAIAVDSTPGIGTRIRVLLPTADAALSPLPPASTAPPVPAPTGAVLVVDDELAVRRLVRRTIDGLGLITLEANEGSEALRVVREHPELRAVVLDATMPGVRGEAVLREIERLRPDLQVILSTGDAQGFASIDPATPNVLWLPKLYSASALREAVAQAIASQGCAGLSDLDRRET